MIYPDGYEEIIAEQELAKAKDKAKEAMDKEAEEKKDVTRAEPGPLPPPMSVNNRLIVETYKEDRGLKSTVSNGFAMVQQKVSVKGLKLLAGGTIGDIFVSKGSLVYIRESSLQSQPWAKASFTSDAIDGEFMIVDASHIEFVEHK